MLSTFFFYFEMICYCCLTWYGSWHSLFVVFHPLEVNQQYLSGLGGEMYCIKSKNRILYGSKQQVCLILLLMDFFRSLWYAGKKTGKILAWRPNLKCFCISYWAWETNATALPSRLLKRFGEKFRSGLMLHIISYIITGDPQLDISPWGGGGLLG